VSSREAWGLLRETLRSWSDDYAPSMGAALSYYTLFSIAPLLLIITAIAGIVFGPDAARGEIFGQLRGLMGDEAAAAIERILKSANRPAQGAFAAAIGFLVLASGATSVFNELQNDLDRIWRIPLEKKSGGLWLLLRTRVLSLGMVLAVAFLLIVSLAASALVAALGDWIGQLAELGASFTLLTVLFAMIFKAMPRTRIAWRDVWVGAAVTSALFGAGKFLIGLYLGRSSVASAFGAAGSIVVVMLWVYYSAQIFLLGAEFTRAYAYRHGSRQPA
jgi:membrane protein